MEVLKFVVFPLCIRASSQCLLALSNVFLLLRDSGYTSINPLRPNNDLIQTSPCNIKGLSVREVMRIENMITQMKFY